MEEKIQKLENEIKSLKDRNSRVETDKAWEVSWVRRFFIATGSYIIAGFWLVIIEDSFPWLKAFVPAGGYILSTLSLSFVKKWWLNKSQR